MKRFLFYLICVCVFVSGCGHTRASGQWQPCSVSVEFETYATKAMDTIDEYLAFEIDRKEAEKTFREIYDRINISSEENNSAELTIYFTVADLYRGADEFSDTDFRRCRDILAFQTGDEVSGNTYAVDKSEFSNVDLTVIRMIGLEDAPVADILYSESDMTFAIVDFDAMAGVKVSELAGYIENSLKKVETLSSFNNICVLYNCYEQPAFGINIVLGLENSGVHVSLTGIKYSGHNEEDYTTLASFDSLDKIPEALKIAESYLGEYAP